VRDYDQNSGKVTFFVTLFLTIFAVIIAIYCFFKILCTFIYHASIALQKLSAKQEAKKQQAERDAPILKAKITQLVTPSESIKYAQYKSSGLYTGIKSSAHGAIESELTKEERTEKRVNQINQNFKAMADYNAKEALEKGAIAAQWGSHWKQKGYDYNPAHKERDGKIYAIRGSWAHKRKLINKGDGFTDEMTMPGEGDGCRCNYVYLYALRDLPSTMLTAKGKNLFEKTRII
jgi:hypothetical protein